MKLVGWEQLAAQGVSGRQVYKGVAGGSQRRGSVASPVMIGTEAGTLRAIIRFPQGV